jgi:hypothetical protein
MVAPGAAHRDERPRRHRGAAGVRGRAGAFRPLVSNKIDLTAGPAGPSRMVAPGGASPPYLERDRATSIVQRDLAGAVDSCPGGGDARPSHPEGHGARALAGAGPVAFGAWRAPASAGASGVRGRRRPAGRREGHGGGRAGSSDTGRAWPSCRRPHDGEGRRPEGQSVPGGAVVWRHIIRRERSTGRPGAPGARGFTGRVAPPTPDWSPALDFRA